MDNRLIEAELEVLYDICSILGKALHLQRSLEMVLSVLSEKLAMKRATVTLLDKVSGQLQICASHGLSAEEQRRGVYQMGEGITGGIGQSGQPFWSPDVSLEPSFLNKTQSRHLDKEKVAFVGVPVVLRGQVIGVLTVDRLFGSEVSAEEDIRFLTIVAQIIGQFVHLNQEVEARERTLRRQNIQLKREVSATYNDFFIVGRSEAMKRVQQMISRVAPSMASVLLLGESGTGKTLVARIIHELSLRAEGPFIKVNCAALPGNLLESELFGHEKGSFTGAHATRAGRFEEADGGTIFLDEIAEMPLELQAKLLRFLQDKEFERLGSSRTIKVDTRIVAATNRELPAMVDAGTFRPDLYYRLNVFPIHIPPLRERPVDIEILLSHFMDRNSSNYGINLTVDPAARRVLLDYPWPGNVREMQNIMERLAIMSDNGRITMDVLPLFLHSASDQPPASVPGPETEPAAFPPRLASPGLPKLWEMEKDQLLLALERNRWVQSRAASELGITLRQMGHRVKKFGIDKLVKQKRAQVLGKY